jgi:acetolactate synthase I/II/III large subunit
MAHAVPSRGLRYGHRVPILGRCENGSAMTGGTALVRQLALEGVTHVSGVPGVQLDHALDAIAQDGRIAFLHTRHEQTASYMADGYARSTGTVGVCMVVPGPGVLNALSGLATAYACSSPVLCVAGQIPSPSIGRGRGLLHEIPNQSSILGSFAKWSAIALTPGEIPELVREAFRRLRSGRPRPVVLEVPPDVLEQTAAIALVEPPADRDEPTVPEREAVARAADLLRGSGRPAIWAGGGCEAAGASTELRRLAELLQAPVVSSPSGRGALDSEHPLALGAIGGRAVLPHADAVLAVGSRFLDGRGDPIGVPDGAKVILLNADESDLGPPRRVDAAVHGDARLGLAALLAELGDEPARRSRAAEVARVRAWCDTQIEAVLGAHLGWVRALRSAIPADGILVGDLTQVGYYCGVAYPVRAPRTFLTPGYQGTLGFGFPTALGAAAGNPGRAVVSISGDGGFGWGLAELATARRHDLGVTVVVFDDGAYGNVRRIQRDRFEGRTIGSDLANPDFVALAAAFGVPASRAESPDALEHELRVSLARGGPGLIHVPLGELPSPWHLIHSFVSPPSPVPPSPLDET